MFPSVSFGKPKIKSLDFSFQKSSLFYQTFPVRATALRITTRTPPIPEAPRPEFEFSPRSIRPDQE